MCAPPVLLKIKKFILFWKGVQSSESLTEEFKKKTHQVFVFTGVWKAQNPHLCVPEITYVWGSMPTRPASHFKSVLNRSISQSRHFYTQHMPILLSAVFVWEWGILHSSCLLWDAFVNSAKLFISPDCSYALWKWEAVFKWFCIKFNTEQPL